MGCSVKTLLATFDSQEISEWQAYFTLEPFGSWADNLNAGKIITTIRSLFAKKGAAPEDAKDFSLGNYKLPIWQTMQTKDEQKSAIEKIATMFGATRVKKDKR